MLLHSLKFLRRLLAMMVGILGKLYFAVYFGRQVDLKQWFH